ncbi:MAG: hypothetical protein JSR44_09520 [Spirochaetes bacterium]|nr:hypothetical protein [Spirochaetota bacterium]
MRLLVIALAIFFVNCVEVPVRVSNAVADGKEGVWVVGHTVRGGQRYYYCRANAQGHVSCSEFFLPRGL